MNQQMNGRARERIVIKSHANERVGESEQGVSARQSKQITSMIQ